MKKILRLVGGCLALIWGTAHACVPIGHHTVGAVADQLINAKAMAEAAPLLADDLDKAGNLSGRNSLRQVANWADAIRSTPENRPRSTI